MVFKYYLPTTLPTFSKPYWTFIFSKYQTAQQLIFLLPLQVGSLRPNEIMRPLEIKLISS